MLFSKSKIYLKQKGLLLVLTLLVATSCARPDITVPKSKYTSEALSKDWRSNILDKKTRSNNYNNTYAYPQDNDAEYVPPRQYQYRPPQQQYYQPPQQQYYQQPQNTYVAPYPQDNDANYGTKYPTYDPDADNSGYYYLNRDKKLPPPRKVDPYNSEQYDYPIYFD